jgi:hypothetical protein
MALPQIRVTREEMRKRVAYFKDLKGFDGGLPDSQYPSAIRKLYNAVGFQPPKGKGGQDVVSPLGAEAAANAAIPISEGFNLGFCEARPGHGPDDAQPRHQRNLHAPHRHLALLLGTGWP